MPRYPYNRRPLLPRLIVWGVVLLVGGWGLWQAGLVWRTILADVGRVGEPVATKPAETRGEALASGMENETTQPMNGVEEEMRPVVEEPTTQMAAERSSRADELLAVADRAAEEGDLLVQRMDLNGALVLIGDGQRSGMIREQLARLNTAVFLGGDVLAGDPYAPLVPIASGDTYERLARRYKITRELLAQINPQVDQRHLKPGAGLKIVHGPFHLRVVKAEQRMDLYARDMYVCSYGAAMEEGSFLPLGTYRAKAGGKVMGLEAGVGGIAFEGLEAGNRDVNKAWLYSAERRVRATSSNGIFAGVCVSDLHLRELYNVLIEQESFIRIDP